MLYYYWVKKGIRPSFFEDLPAGEKTVIFAFYEKEIEEFSELQREVE